MLGAGIVAVENATGSITAGAVPLGVTKVAVEVLTNGLMFNVDDDADKKLHKILARVPFSNSLGGAICVNNPAIPPFEIPSEMSILNTIERVLTVLSTYCLLTDSDNSVDVNTGFG